MKGLVLCGGSGTRLVPFTFSIPKQLIPVANRPVLCYVLDAFKKAGIKEIGVIIGERGEMFREKLEDLAPSGLHLTYIKQAKPLGLAHAVQTAQPFLKGSDFMMILGDNLFVQDLEGALCIFKEQHADSLISLTPVDEPQRYGIAEVQQGKIISLREKPCAPRSNLAVMGIYIFKSTIFTAIERIVPSWRGELEITDAIQELINMGGKVIPYLFPGWWIDMGTPEDVLEANKTVLALLTGSGTLSKKEAFSSTAPPLCLVALSASIKGSKLRGPLLIGKGCHVAGSEIGPYVSIGPGCHVEGSIVENSVLLERVTIKGLKTSLKDSIIGPDSVIVQGKRSGTQSFLVGSSSFLRL
jgi:glucose-1-phosphate thymidylyltransferase